MMQAIYYPFFHHSKELENAIASPTNGELFGDSATGGAT